MWAPKDFDALKLDHFDDISGGTRKEDIIDVDADALLRVGEFPISAQTSNRDVVLKITAKATL